MSDNHVFWTIHTNGSPQAGPMPANGHVFSSAAEACAFAGAISALTSTGTEMDVVGWDDVGPDHRYDGVRIATFRDAKQIYPEP